MPKESRLGSPVRPVDQRLQDPPLHRTGPWKVYPQSAPTRGSHSSSHSVGVPGTGQCRREFAARLEAWASSATSRDEPPSAPPQHPHQPCSVWQCSSISPARLHPGLWSLNWTLRMRQAPENENTNMRMFLWCLPRRCAPTLNWAARASFLSISEKEQPTGHVRSAQNWLQVKRICCCGDACSCFFSRGGGALNASTAASDADYCADDMGQCTAAEQQQGRVVVVRPDSGPGAWGMCCSQALGTMPLLAASRKAHWGGLVVQSCERHLHEGVPRNEERCMCRRRAHTCGRLGVGVCRPEFGQCRVPLLRLIQIQVEVHVEAPSLDTDRLRAGPSKVRVRGCRLGKAL